MIILVAFVAMGLAAFGVLFGLLKMLRNPIGLAVILFGLAVLGVEALIGHGINKVQDSAPHFTTATEPAAPVVKARGPVTLVFWGTPGILHMRVWSETTCSLEITYFHNGQKRGPFNRPCGTPESRARKVFVHMEKFESPEKFAQCYGSDGSVAQYECEGSASLVHVDGAGLIDGPLPLTSITPSNFRIPDDVVVAEVNGVPDAKIGHKYNAPYAEADMRAAEASMEDEAAAY